MNDQAPIVLFCYNRPWHVEQTLNALSLNHGADQSVLYIFCDGPKAEATQEQIEKINEVRKVVRQKKWCKEVYIKENPINKGLAVSIVTGVTEIVKKYGKVIVLEDDVVTSKGFLEYMNSALNFYLETERVMHISAYMYPHKQRLPETFFYEVPYPGGGWATWERAWKYYDDDVVGLYDYWKNHWNIFNKFGGDYLQKQLEQNYNGSLHTWFIKWHAVLLQRNGLTLYPHTSLTNNIGFDDTGSNCFSTNKFDVWDLAQHVHVGSVPIKENRKAARIIYQFYQGKWYNKRNRMKFYKLIKSILCLGPNR